MGRRPGSSEMNTGDSSDGTTNVTDELIFASETPEETQDLPLATRDVRALQTYAALGVRVE